MAVASPRNAIHSVFERVGVYGFGGGGSQKRLKYEIHEEKDYAEEDNMEMVQLGAERTKNVLILMSDTGGGHRASAEAIRDAFQLQFGDEYRVIFRVFFKVLLWSFSLFCFFPCNFFLTCYDLWVFDLNTDLFFHRSKIILYCLLNVQGG